MSFMLKKKKYKFQVNLEVEELSSVPFVSGILFSKIRLVDGGNFTDITPSVELMNHRVRWKAKYLFVCKMMANASTGVLDSCVCRISVRKEIKGGKAHQKLGFADLNLAEFAGAGRTSRRYLLEGYDSSQRRPDNSILKVNIDTTLLSGDPCFKVPVSRSQGEPGETIDHNLHEENKSLYPSGDSVASGSSGFNSLSRRRKGSLGSTESCGSSMADIKHDSTPEFEVGHSRQDSSASQQSKRSDYSSLHTHSRQSSYDCRDPTGEDRFGSLNRQEHQNKGSLKKKLEQQSSLERRVDSTRINNDELIDELLQSTDLGPDSAETSGLQLFIAKDGTTVLGSHEVKNHPGTKSYQKVVIEER